MDPANIAYGVILIILGIIYNFFGYKFFRFIAAFIGFAFVSVITLNIIQNSAPDMDNGLRVGIVIGVGLIGAIIASFFWRFAVVALGALLGYSLAVFINGTHAPNGLIENQVAKIIFFVALSIFGALIALLLVKWIIILGTSSTGSSFLVLGFDLIANTGYANAFLSISPSNVEQTILPSDATAYTIAYFVLFVVGILVQALVTGKNVDEPGKRRVVRQMEIEA